MVTPMRWGIPIPKIDPFLVFLAGMVLAASLFHFGEFTIGQVKEYLRERGVVVR